MHDIYIHAGLLYYINEATVVISVININKNVSSWSSVLLKINIVLAF